MKGRNEKNEQEKQEIEKIEEIKKKPPKNFNERERSSSKEKNNKDLTTKNETSSEISSSNEDKVENEDGDKDNEKVENEVEEVEKVPNKKNSKNNSIVEDEEKVEKEYLKECKILKIADNNIMLCCKKDFLQVYKNLKSVNENLFTLKIGKFFFNCFLINTQISF